jgi:hypothetical protein
MDDTDIRRLVEIYKKCDAFFKEAIEAAIKNQHLDLSDEAKFYALSILLMGIKIDPTAEKKSLAEKFLTGQINDPETLRLVGDYSLMIAGIYWQSLLRKLVDVDYYIGLGEQSYQRASEHAPRNLSELLEELSKNFSGLVDILMEASRSITENKMTNADILRMYEVWLRTNNIFIEQKLRSLGITVVPGKTTKQ